MYPISRSLVFFCLSQWAVFCLLRSPLLRGRPGDSSHSWEDPKHTSLDDSAPSLLGSKSHSGNSSVFLSLCSRGSGQQLEK